MKIYRRRDQKAIWNLALVVYEYMKWNWLHDHSRKPILRIQRLQFEKFVTVLWVCGNRTFAKYRMAFRYIICVNGKTQCSISTMTIVVSFSFLQYYKNAARRCIASVYHSHISRCMKRLTVRTWEMLVQRKHAVYPQWGWNLQYLQSKPISGIRVFYKCYHIAQQH